MVKKVPCVAYCPMSVAQHAQRVLDQSHVLIWEIITGCPIGYVAKRVLNIKELV